jgi:hypothetical protein
MASSRRRFAIWACVFGTATLVVGIGVATGAKKLKTKSASETLSAGEFDDVTAKCKKGTKAVSGGFASENDPAGSGEAILPYMSRAEGGRKWTSAGVGISAVSGDLTSFAYCRDQKIKRRSDEETLSGGETDTVTATCPQGTKVASGGFDNPDFVLNGTDIVIFPTESLKTGKREWTVSATNLTGNPGELMGQVNCQEGKGLRTFDETLSITSPGVHDVEAECGGGRQVVSGGFEYSLPPSEGAYVSASHKVGKREWEVEAVDFDAPATLTAYAYCEKKKKK